MGRFKYRGKDDRRVRQRVDRDNEDEDQEHDGGSVPLEEIKKSEEYTRRTEYLGIPKKKYAVCFGYLGTNYQGLKMNPGAVTIESMLEKALLIDCTFIIFIIFITFFYKNFSFGDCTFLLNIRKKCNFCRHVIKFYFFV